jgi:NAD-dependent histone deacetylase SIR2
MPRWDDPITFKEVTEDEVNKSKEKQKPVVVVPMATPKKHIQVTQMLTPAASPRMDADVKEIQEAPTPSKPRGRKRKSDGQPIDTQAKAKAAPKRQTQRKAPAKKKAVDENQKMMTSMFSVAKSGTAPRRTAGKKQANTQPAVKPEAGSHFNTLNVLDFQSASKRSQGLKAEPKTPVLRRRTITYWKHEMLSDITDSDARCNMSPVKPEVEPFTSQPCSPEPSTPRFYTPPSGHADDYYTADEARPSTADSRKSDTIIPPSAPRDLHCLLDMTG